MVEYAQKMYSENSATSLALQLRMRYSISTTSESEHMITLAAVFGLGIVAGIFIALMLRGKKG